MLIDKLIPLLFYTHLHTRESFEKIYRIEQNEKMKERMLLLVINLVYQGKTPAPSIKTFKDLILWHVNG